MQSDCVCVCRERPLGSIMVKNKKKRKKKRLRGPKTTEGSPSSSLPGGKKIFFNGSREFRLKVLVVCSKINLEAVGPYSGYFFFVLSRSMARLLVGKERSFGVEQKRGEMQVNVGF